MRTSTPRFAAKRSAVMVALSKIRYGVVIHSVSCAWVIRSR